MGLKPAELWSRFDWQGGSCFRCERTGLPVTEIGDIAVAGETFALQACQWCVFRLEQLHYTMSERALRRQGPRTPAPAPPRPITQWPTSAPLDRPPAHVA
ncbi:hypothetical protein OG889_24090 [Streptomyces sp. NBC_00481]|jgi:hypothetical protein|uniref:hypothetical protein n=1 Tax=Streptomyces sp. NBC_00481 TaxID=2975755 RepID=UPI002DDC499B|nr:hypothetical protein [Streptomyces sp. NBC_00481]WRY97520.1 hypothetical protein OG889_24090 [Streptomyces sp. NBC_00481]